MSVDTAVATPAATEAGVVANDAPPPGAAVAEDTSDPATEPMITADPEINSPLPTPDGDPSDNAMATDANKFDAVPTGSGSEEAVPSDTDAVPDSSSKEIVSLIDAEEKVPLVDTEGKVPLVDVEEKIPLADATEIAPLAAAEENVPVIDAEKKVPLVDADEKSPEPLPTASNEVVEPVTTENVDENATELEESWPNRREWITYAKMVGALLVFMLYLCLLQFVKDVYIREQRLDRIYQMTEKTEEMILSLHMMDDNIALNVRDLESIYMEY